LQQALAGLDSSLDPKRAKRWARKKTKQQCKIWSTICDS
jgi:hypothetical protein